MTLKGYRERTDRSQKPEVIGSSNSFARQPHPRSLRRLPEIEVRDLSAYRQIANPKHRRAADNHNAVIAHTRPTILTAGMMDADPGNGEDGLEKQDNGDGEQDEE